MTTATYFEDLPKDRLEEEFDSERRATAPKLVMHLKASEGDDGHNEMAGEFSDPTAIRRFLLAGNAMITIEAKKSRKRFTFRFSRPDESEARASGRERPIWVSLLSGPDNSADYAYLGTIWPDGQAWRYAHGRKSRVAEDAPGALAIRWFVALLQRDPAKLFEQAGVWHEGRCGRCGRRLTVPESIASGFGPECINHV
jgi:hypothetical protein